MTKKKSWKRERKMKINKKEFKVAQWNIDGVDK